MAQRKDDMSKQVWICEKCHSLWKDEQAAKDCEARHPDIDKFEVAAAYYNPKFYPESRNADVPDMVQIRLLSRTGTMYWDYATYVLERIGPKGC